MVSATVHWVTRLRSLGMIHGWILPQLGPEGRQMLPLSNTSKSPHKRAGDAHRTKGLDSVHFTVIALETDICCLIHLDLGPVRKNTTECLH